MNDATKILAAFLMIAAGLGFFLAIIAVVIKLIGTFGGWSDLAKKYGTTQPPPRGTRRTFQSLRIGRFARYNSALTFIFSTQGFYIAAWGPFRFGHTPLLIPWDDIHNVTEEKIIFWNFLNFEIGQPTVAKASLALNRSTLELMKEYLPVKFPAVRDKMV